MVLFRTKINIALLALSIAGSHLNAADGGYIAQAKQKARDLRDWSVQVSDKARKKANDAYAFIREKAEENKKIVAGIAAYLAVEGILKLSGNPTLFNRIFFLPNELTTVRANNQNITPQLNIACANLNAVDTVTITNLRGNIAKLEGQLNTANDNLNAANNTIRDRNGDLIRSDERLMNVLDENRKEQQKLIDQLNQARAQAQQVQQQQPQADIARLEHQNEHDKAVFSIVTKNFLEQSKDLHIAQGRAQLVLEQRHNAIVATLNSVENELQGAVQDGQYQAIDACGIINDLMHQIHGLVQCRTAYHDQQDKIAEIDGNFERAFALLQQTINHVVNQISFDAQWLEDNTKEMNFTDIVADNFDQKNNEISSELANYFAQLNAACNQLKLIIDLGLNDKIIGSCIHKVAQQSQSIEASLEAMIFNSAEKVRQLLRQDGNTIVVDSYDAKLNAYMHSFVAASAYAVYHKFLFDGSDSECPEHMKSVEPMLCIIKDNILTDLVQVKNESFDGMKTVVGLNELHSSMVDMLNNSGLNQSCVNNLDLSAFLANPIVSLDKSSSLTSSWMTKTHLGASSEFASTNGNPVDDLDALLTLATAKGEKEWNDELNAMDQSICDFGNSSALNLNNSFLTWSKVMANSVTQSVNVTNSINVGDSINLSASVASFVGNASMNPCPYVPAERWARAQAKLDQSGHFDNRKRYSMVSNFAPIYVNRPNTRSVLLNTNNNIAKPATRAVGNLISKFETDGLVNSQKRPVVKNTPKYTVTDLVNELGESITPQTNAANAAENSGTIDTLKALLTLDESTTTATSTNPAHPDGYHDIDYYSYTGDDVDSGK